MEGLKQREFLDGEITDEDRIYGGARAGGKGDLAFLRLLQSYWDNMCFNIELGMERDRMDKTLPYYRRYAQRGKKW